MGYRSLSKIFVQIFFYGALLILYEIYFQIPIFRNSRLDDITKMCRKFFYGASLILRKYYGALLTSPDKLWGISQNRKIEKCDPPPYHDLLMTAPLPCGFRQTRVPFFISLGNV